MRKPSKSLLLVMLRLLRTFSWILMIGLLLVLYPITYTISGESMSTGAKALPTSENGDEEKFVSWVIANAIRLDSLDWTKIDLKDLSFLDDALQGKRIVYLGEADHYVHEKYDYRLILIRYLFERGWRHIGNEMGRSDGKRIDQFIATGDPSHLDRVAIYGYRGALRSDRNDYAKGIARIALAKSKEWREALFAEERWFAHQLRNLSETRVHGSPRIEFFGFDYDPLAGGGYEDAEAVLAPYKADSTIAQIRKRLARVKNESIDDEIARLNRVVDYIQSKRSSLQHLMGADHYNELLNSLLCLRDSFRVVKVNGYDVTPSVRIEALKDRERSMFRQVKEKISKLKPEEKIILMGHNTHLSKDYTTLRFGPMNASNPSWPTIGTFVAKLLPGQVYSIWMLYDHGRHSDLFCPEESCPVESNKDRVEYLLSQASARVFLLPLFPSDRRNKFLDENRNFICNGCDGLYANGILTRQADLVFFIREVTQLRPR